MKIKEILQSTQTSFLHSYAQRKGKGNKLHDNDLSYTFTFILIMI
jgi:hypothetical protein